MDLNINFEISVFWFFETDKLNIWVMNDQTGQENQEIGADSYGLVRIWLKTRVLQPMKKLGYFTVILRHILVYGIADLSLTKEVRKCVLDCSIMRNDDEGE